MIPDDRLSIVPLEVRHQRKIFDCGQTDLNRYLQQTARQHQKKQVSRTWVAVDPVQPETILGFYTTTLAEILPKFFNPEEARGLPKTALQVVRVSRLAVDQQQQGRKIGQRLLIDAMLRTVGLLESFALVAMVVDAKNNQVATYYQRFGFIPWRDDELKLYLPTQTLLSLVFPNII